MGQDSVRKSPAQLPEPSLDHLKRLTDDTGLLQHAKFTVPDRDFGYCTDDNARAVMVMALYLTHVPSSEGVSFFDRYMSFVLHSQTDSGQVRNFMNYDRTWLEDQPEHDALGRLLWALGTVIARPPGPCYLPIARECFGRSLVHVPKLSPRGMAYAIFGMAQYLRRFPDAPDIKQAISLAADRLVTLYTENRRGDWDWFETLISYDNAVLPCALFIADGLCGPGRYIEAAERTCRFLLQLIFQNDHFSFIGCNGWFWRDGPRAAFDQQPLEVPGTIMMLDAAARALGQDKFLSLKPKAFDWFMGANDLQASLYDSSTGGCHDALTRDGVSGNQGAESLLSFMFSLLMIKGGWPETSDE